MKTLPTLDETLASIQNSRPAAQENGYDAALISILKTFGLDCEVPELHNDWNPELPILNAAECREALDQEAWEQSIHDEDQEQRSIYLGTIMSWSPSGKVYAPWSTNVSEAEAALDEAWREALEKEAAALGCFIESGEGDPCDLYLVECRECEQPEEEDDDHERWANREIKPFSR